MSFRRTSIIIVVSLMLLLLNSSVAGHTPVDPGTGDSLDDAVEIPNPTKSWVIYSEIHEAGEGHYYKFHMNQDERIRFTIMIPNYMADSGFVPGAVLMGPGLIDQGVAPSYVEIANGTGIVAVDGVIPDHAEYEGFTPSTFNTLLDVDIIAPETGEYYLVVHDPSMSGPFGIAFGYVESFTLDEWILVPLDVIGIYLWEGQSLAIVLAPMILTVILGLALVVTRRRDKLTDWDVATWLGLFAGLLFFGSASSFGFQIIYSLIQSATSAQVLISGIFALIPALLGLMTIRIVMNKEGFHLKSNQLKLIGVGIISLFGWAGLLLGPVLAMAAGGIKYVINR
ncbi:MAG: hypothetical protein ACW968_13585 [Candidatus Thorarchaeota archaeon]|jgi:hypothetical protein